MINTSNMMNISIIGEDSMSEANRLYQERAKNLLKAELKRKGTSYKKLAQLLSEIGIQESERNIANKISRGAFTTAFFLQCLDVIGTKSVAINDE